MRKFIVKKSTEAEFGVEAEGFEEAFKKVDEWESAEWKSDVLTVNVRDDCSRSETHV